MGHRRESFDMQEIAIVGAGKIGSMIAELLVSSRDYAVTVIDRSQAQLDRLETAASVTKVAADITQGNNGSYSAGPGWDPCTGLGSPNGNQLSQIFATATAGAAKSVPATASRGGKPAHAGD